MLGASWPLPADPPRVVSLEEPEPRLEHCIEFVVRGNPPPTLRWLHNGQPLRESRIIRVEHYQEGEVSEGCLLFNKPTHYNNGNYTLIAQNPLGTASQTINGHFLKEPFPGEGGRGSGAPGFCLGAWGLGRQLQGSGGTDVDPAALHHPSATPVVPVSGVGSLVSNSHHGANQAPGKRTVMRVRMQRVPWGKRGLERLTGRAGTLDAGFSLLGDSGHVVAFRRHHLLVCERDRHRHTAPVGIWAPK